MTDNRPDPFELHNVKLPDNYIPSPGSHLTNARDCEHYLNTLQNAIELDANSVLDIGAYDGWHAFLLELDGYEVQMVEFIPDLVKAAYRYIETHKIKGVSIIEADWLGANIPPEKKFDIITAYEVLEHVPLTKVPEWVAKMEYYGKRICISLPNQDHNQNQQHQWTPNEHIIKFLFGNKKNFRLQYREYPINKSIPGNWFIAYDS